FREAQASATITHPNICPVYDVGEAEGQNYIVMAFVDGCPLSEFVQESKGLTPRVIAGQLRKVALALQAAHGKGIVHRDLKPANIMIEQERQEPIVMDFGLAQRADDGDAKLTREGTILGTPAYMAPEQAAGDGAEVGPLADVYSLGVILYELLAGDVPFTGPLMAVLAQVLNTEPVPPSAERDNVDSRLEKICLKAMAKKPEDRYQSMKQLADAFRGYLKAPASSVPTEKRTAKDVAAGKKKPSTPKRPVSKDPTVVSQRKRKKRPASENKTSQAIERESPPQTAEEKPSSIKTYLLMAALVLVLGGGAFGVYGIVTYLGRGGEVQLEIVDLPTDDSITISIDTRPLSRSDALKPLPLDVGHHLLYVKRGDLTLIDQSITVETGQKQTVSLDIGEAFFRIFELPTAKSVVASSGTVTILAGNSSQEISAEGDLPTVRFAVTGVSFADVGVIADVNAGSTFDFDDLTELAALTTLSLRNCEVSSQAIAAINQLDGLHSLDLNGSNLTDSGLAEFADIAGLEELSLNQTQITDVGIVHLLRLKNLSVLSLDQTAITDASFDLLEQMKSLNTLTVTSTKLGEKSLTALKSALSGCDIRHDPFVDPKQRELAEWVLSNGGTIDIELPNGEERPILDSISLPVTRYYVVGAVFPKQQPLDDEVAALLANGVKLKKLSFEESQIGNAELKQVAQVSSLDSLDLRASRVTSAGLVELKGLPNLKSLILDGDQLSDGGLDALSQLPQFAHLISDGPCGNVADWSLISELKKIETLSLTNANLDDSAAAAIASLVGIRELDLSGNRKISDAGIAQLKALSSLQVLSLRGTGLSDASIPVLISMKSLKGLNTSSTRFSFTGVSSIERVLTGCHVVGGVTPSYQMDLETPPIGSLPTGWTGDAAMRIIEVHGLRAISSAQAGITQVTSPEFKIDGDFFVQLDLLDPHESQFTLTLLGDRGPDLDIEVTPKSGNWIVTVPDDEEDTEELVEALQFSPAQFRLERWGNDYYLSMDGFALGGKSVGLFGRIGGGRDGSRLVLDGEADECYQEGYQEDSGGNSTPGVMQTGGVSFSTTRFKRFRGIRFVSTVGTAADQRVSLSRLKLGQLEDHRNRHSDKEGVTQPHVLDLKPKSVPEGWKLYPGKDATHARLQFADCEIRGDFVVRYRMEKLQSACAFQMRMRGTGDAGDLPLGFIAGGVASLGGFRGLDVSDARVAAKLRSRLSRSGGATARLIFPGSDPIPLASESRFIGFQVARKGDVISVQVDGRIVATLRSTRYRDFNLIDFDMRDTKFTDFEVLPLTDSEPPVGPGPKPPRRRPKSKKKPDPELPSGAGQPPSPPPSPKQKGRRSRSKP
ncbi:MAG: protein kinase, partial [Planctomycetaceae bacterium]|nr:protein kinase [Planctomycetaceae bacterium]